MLTKQTKSALDNYFKEDYSFLLEVTTKIIKKNKRFVDDSIDVLNTTILELYEKHEDKVVKLVSNKALRWYMIRVLKTSITSETSGYQRKWMRHENSEDAGSFLVLLELTPYVEYVDPLEIEAFILKTLEKNFNWYEKEIFLNMVHKGLTYLQYSKKTTIPVSELFATFHKVKKLLKSETLKEFARQYNE